MLSLELSVYFWFEIDRVTVKQDVTQDGIAAEAQIVNVDSTDSGPYFCQASNLYGRDQQLVQLQVLEPPEAPKTLTAALITSRSVNLKWQPRGSDANEVTKYIIEYMEHDGTWQEIVIADPPQYTALIENLKPATRYTFRVIAEGQAGQSAPSQELQVKTEPQRPGEFTLAQWHCHGTIISLSIKKNTRANETKRKESICKRKFFRFEVTNNIRLIGCEIKMYVYLFAFH